MGEAKVHFHGANWDTKVSQCGYYTDKFSVVLQEITCKHCINQWLSVFPEDSGEFNPSTKQERTVLAFTN